MTRNMNNWASALAFAGTLFCAYGFAPIASARQAAQSSPAQSQPSQQQPAAGDKAKPQAAPLQLDTPQGTAQSQAAPTVPPTPAEETDYKAFQAIPQNDVDKRIPAAAISRKE